MSSRSRWLVFLISTPIVLFVTVGGLLGAPRPSAAQDFPNRPVFEDVLSLILNAYVEPVDMEKVLEGAMRGLADTLDTSSAYLLPDEVKTIEANVPPPAGDVGLVVTRQFWLRVIGVRDGSPAARAGLQTGDFVRMIDGKSTRDLSGIAGMRLLRGAPGSKVSLSVVRGNPSDPHVFDLVRAVPSADVLTQKPLPNGAAHVRIASFAPSVATGLKAMFDAMPKGKITHAVIDVRGTADGAVEDGIAAARLFVKSGTLAVRGGRGDEKVTSTAAAGDGAITLPVVVLMSNGTAGAAEVFAAALGGNNRAELVGEPTAGIAAVQKLVRLPENHGLWLTYARYFTVDGKDPIHERGLRPTYGVEIPRVGFDELRPATDEPLTKAAERARSLYILKK
jgi:carboxyl-terminal processing protease